MKKSFKVYFGAILALISLQLFAGVKVTDLDLKLGKNQGTLIAHLSGISTELPDLKINRNIIELEIDKSENFSSINKKIHGVNLLASHINEKASIKAVLPYSVSSQDIQTNFLNDRIEIHFPRNRQMMIPKEVVAEPIINNASQESPKNIQDNKIEKSHLNEKYLNNLISEVKSKKIEQKPVVSDQISLKLSSPDKLNSNTEPKKNDNEFSFVSYVFKFLFFLGIVLGLFYGLVQLMKKGVLNRGKLSFLNNSKLVEVLNTTYISPKRSLLLVKAHNQVFLVSNSENGLQYMTELKDTAALMRETEKTISGTNFDDSYIKFEESENLDVKVKEDIYSSTEEVKTSDLIKKDVVKFSEELKKKAKRLKPIENRVN